MVITYKVILFLFDQVLLEKLPIIYFDIKFMKFYIISNFSAHTLQFKIDPLLRQLF